MCTKYVEKRMFERRVRRSYALFVRSFSERDLAAVVMVDMYRNQEWLLVMNVNNPLLQTYLKSVSTRKYRWVQLRLISSDG